MDNMKPLHCMTFLAPNQIPLQRFVAETIGKRFNRPVKFTVGQVYADVFAADVAFICGLPYVRRATSQTLPVPLEAIAAPVLIGERYCDKPIYFSDVIVRYDSPSTQFSDLRGTRWAFNEPESQSGYGITRYHLLQMGETDGFFSEVINAGYHQEAIRMVCDGRIDAAAIDSHVLALALRDTPELASQIRTIATLGPSTIQPVTVRANMPSDEKSALQQALTTLHDDPPAQRELARGLVARYVALDDSAYADIRQMEAACKAANFFELR